MLRTTTGGRRKEPVGGVMKTVFHTSKKHKLTNMVEMTTEEETDLFMCLGEVVGILSMRLGYLQVNKLAIP